MEKVIIRKGWRKYFTAIYWRLQVPFFFFIGRPLNIVETASFEVDDDSALGKLLKGEEQERGSPDNAVPGYVLGVDFGKDRNYTVATCARCKKSTEIIGGKLPPTGWCGCQNAEQECT